ncbi:hypothetical protein CD351_08710 [Erythrobacter sp. KY5]|uniref:hypothetical protein n=1 Tax=Erythrobacter sp. KY5 TaxID=2011159 RepID=UPI000DBF1087|nr:hypothetical protein [Erythrobacter sp. KY5]AWW74505.1 hypothetical protein CD351_08710 [Erythrobacter sp. KY5]
MNRLLALSAATAALTLTPAALAKADGDETGAQAASVAAGEATPVRLKEWTGDWELMKTSRRMRVWRSHLAYKLTVDAAGEVTDCEITEEFRMRRVSDRLCDVLSEHHMFEPAHNAAGAPVEGSYVSRISYMDVRNRLEGE